MKFIFIGGTYSPPHVGHLGIIESVVKLCADDKNTRIMLLPSADGQPVLGKQPSASQQHRYHMTSMMVQAINQTQPSPPMLSVSDLEIVLGDVTGMPSYTANTLIVLRQGLTSLLNKPENLLTIHEKTGSSTKQRALIHKRCTSIYHYLNTPHHPCLTANGIVNQDDEIILVYGADSLHHMSQWYDVNTLTQAVTALWIIPRSGIDMQAAKHTLAQTHPILARKILFCTHTAKLSPSASSTQVRNAIRALSTSPEKARCLLKNTMPADILQYIYDHGLYLPLSKTVSINTDNAQAYKDH